MLKISMRAARVNANLTRREAAEMLGITLDTLRNYESGRTIPRADIMAKMEEVYRFPAEYIKFF